MQSQKAVFIGTGAIAREHLLALKSYDNIEAAAVCDLSPARAEMTAERFGVKQWFSDHRKMLDEIDADLVHICTPPQSHFGLSHYCLSEGFNVLCEKPITQTYAEFTQLRTLAESKGVHLFESQNYRTHSSVMRMRQMVERGELGDVVEVKVQVHLGIHGKGSVFDDKSVSHYSASQRGGVTGDFITHMTYLVQLFIGGDIEAATAWQHFNANASSSADEFRALMKGQRALGYMSFSGNTQPNGFWVQVSGTKGQVESNLFEPPRVVRRMLRGGAVPIATMKDGFVESLDVFKGAFQPFWRKLAGTSRYDGLGPYIKEIYDGIGGRAPLPLTLPQLDQSCRLIEELLDKEAAI